MDIRFMHVWNALDTLRTDINLGYIKDTVMQVSMVEDDPGSGKMIECLTIKATKVTQPTHYDSFKTPTTQEFTIEIFSDSENRPPRYTIQATRDLEKNEKS